MIVEGLYTKVNLFWHFAQIVIKINKAPISKGQALFPKADFPSSAYSLPALKDSKTSKCHPVPITCY